MRARRGGERCGALGGETTGGRKRRGVKRVERHLTAPPAASSGQLECRSRGWAIWWRYATG